jgi:hypothetical protein
MKTREEAREWAIDRTTANLLLGEFSETEPKNVGAALESVSEGVQEVAAKLLHAIAHEKRAPVKAQYFEQLGRLLSGSIQNHCAREARAEAERLVDNAECGHCFDMGCHMCHVREAA